MADLKINKDLWLDSALTPDYTRLEYIENTGAQYICTDYYHNTYRTKYVFEVVPTGFNSYNAAFGARTAHNANDAYYLGWRSDSTTYGCIGGTKIDPLGWTIALNNHYTITIDPTVGLIVNGTTYSNFKPSSKTNGVDPIDIFGFKANGVNAERMIGRIYYFKIYEDNSLRYDFVPAKRNSDNAIGMYDMTSGQFFTNGGTGSFIAGPSMGPLSISPYDPNVNSLEGNLRLVGWGVTDTVGISATTWGNRGLNGGTIVFDDRYMYTTNGKNLYTKKAGYYFIVWQYRPSNVSASQGVGIRLNSEDMGDGKLWTWGGGGNKSPYRTMLNGFEGIQLAADTGISAVIYCQSADTLHPMNVWVYVVENGA